MRSCPVKKLDFIALYWLTDEQKVRLKSCPEKPRPASGDDLSVLTGIIFVNRNGLRWLNAL